MLHEGDNVQSLEVGQARRELREELVWRGCIDDENRQAPEGCRGPGEHFESAVAML